MRKLKIGEANKLLTAPQGKMSIFNKLRNYEAPINELIPFSQFIRNFKTAIQPIFNHQDAIVNDYNSGLNTLIKDTDIKPFSSGTPILLINEDTLNKQHPELIESYKLLCDSLNNTLNAYFLEDVELPELNINLCSKLILSEDELEILQDTILIDNENK